MEKDIKRKWSTVRVSRVRVEENIKRRTRKWYTVRVSRVRREVMQEIIAANLFKKIPSQKRTFKNFLNLEFKVSADALFKAFSHVRDVDKTFQNLNSSEMVSKISEYVSVDFDLLEKDKRYKDSLCKSLLYYAKRAIGLIPEARKLSKAELTNMASSFINSIIGEKYKEIMFDEKIESAKARLSHVNCHNDSNEINSAYKDEKDEYEPTRY